MRITAETSSEICTYYVGIVVQDLGYLNSRKDSGPPTKLWHVVYIYTHVCILILSGFLTRYDRRLLKLSNCVLVHVRDFQLAGCYPYFELCMRLCLSRIRFALYEIAILFVYSSFTVGFRLPFGRFPVAILSGWLNYSRWIYPKCRVAIRSFASGGLRVNWPICAVGMYVDVCVTDLLWKCKSSPPIACKWPARFIFGFPLFIIIIYI